VLSWKELLGIGDGTWVLHGTDGELRAEENITLAERILQTEELLVSLDAELVELEDVVSFLLSEREETFSAVDSHWGVAVSLGLLEVDSLVRTADDVVEVRREGQRWLESPVAITLEGWEVSQDVSLETIEVLLGAERVVAGKVDNWVSRSDDQPVSWSGGVDSQVTLEVRLVEHWADSVTPVRLALSVEILSSIDIDEGVKTITISEVFVLENHGGKVNMADSK